MARPSAASGGQRPRQRPSAALRARLACLLARLAFALRARLAFALRARLPSRFALACLRASRSPAFALCARLAFGVGYFDLAVGYFDLAFLGGWRRLLLARLVVVTAEGCRWETRLVPLEPEAEWAPADGDGDRSLEELEELDASEELEHEEGGQAGAEDEGRELR